jgi:sigma-B regulation protein RsbU (phosphoserine phosphatase)
MTRFKERGLGDVIMSKIPSNANLLQQLMDNMTDNIFFKDRDHKFIMINQANARWFGFSNSQEAVGKTDFDLFEEEFAQKAQEDEEQVMASGTPMLGDEEQTVHDGEVVWGHVTKVPLRDNAGQVIGIIGIGRDITVLKHKESELADANRKLAAANDQISEDLQMAARLQQTFLPQNYPSFTSADGKELLSFHHYYEPDIEIGGDFCAVHKLSDTKAGLLICDVMGHGVRAALITSMIRTISDNLAHQVDSPGDFLTAMNRQLHPMLQTQDEFLFATACYLTIDTESGLLSGAMAGHTVPFLIRPDQALVSPLTIAAENSGPALAITADHDYQTFSMQLAPGDKVLMYTDGICEALDSNGNEFGTDRLQHTIQDCSELPLKELFTRIVQAVHDHAGSEKLGDDICLLGFTLNGLK